MSLANLAELPVALPETLYTLRHSDHQHNEATFVVMPQCLVRHWQHVAWQISPTCNPELCMILNFEDRKVEETSSLTKDSYSVVQS